MSMGSNVSQNRKWNSLLRLGCRILVVTTITKLVGRRRHDGVYWQAERLGMSNHGNVEGSASTESRFSCPSQSGNRSQLTAHGTALRELLLSISNWPSLLIFTGHKWRHSVHSVAFKMLTVTVGWLNDVKIKIDEVYSSYTLSTELN